MSNFIAEIQELITEYGYTDVSDLCVTLSIETFRDLRNYPKSFTDDKKLSDMRENSSKIAMAAIEIDSKQGAENQTAHSDNGTNRTFSKNIMAYSHVIGYADCI